MHIAEILSPSSIACEVIVKDKDEALRYLATLMQCSDGDFDFTEIYSSFIEREQLGSTGLGRGIALPHGRINREGRIIASFLRLKNPIDFEASDGQPVDILFALLSLNHHGDGHLFALAQLAEMLSNRSFVERLRTSSCVELYPMIENWKSSD